MIFHGEQTNDNVACQERILYEQKTARERERKREEGSRRIENKKIMSDKVGERERRWASESLAAILFIYFFFIYPLLDILFQT